MTSASEVPALELLDWSSLTSVAFGEPVEGFVGGDEDSERGLAGEGFSELASLEGGDESGKVGSGSNS